MLTTTYAVGELSAINGVMGAKAENNVIFHLAGAPAERLTRCRRHLHHSLGDGETGQFYPLSAASACVYTKLTPNNAVAEMERVITTALANRQPAFIQIPQDYGRMEISGDPITGVPLSQIPSPSSEKTELGDAITAILNRLRIAKKPVLLASYKLGRFGAADIAEKLINALNVPFATTFMDKSVISEAHPLFIGHYRGNLKSTDAVKDIIEGSDCVLDLGACLFDDLSMFGSVLISEQNHIVIAPNHVELMKDAGMVSTSMTSFSPVWMGDVMNALIEEASTLPKYEPRVIPAPLVPESVDSAGIITYQSMHSQLQSFFEPKDVIMVETGTASVQLATMRLPAGAAYHNQTLWGSIGKIYYFNFLSILFEAFFPYVSKIRSNLFTLYYFIIVGWATPAALGTALGAPDRRTILITGDGSHQMTATEIGTMGRYGTNPIIVCINNALYGVEEYLEENIPRSYNDLTPWEYAQLPATLGCKGWKGIKVNTNAEFVAALKDARAQTATGTYIEVILGVALLPPLSVSMLHQVDMEKNPSYKYTA